MLHYYGNILALELGEAAKAGIQWYHKAGQSVCLVPFIDLESGMKRFVKFEFMAGQWMFVDITD
jgi:hypothetical protein